MRCLRCAGLRVPEIISEGGTRVLAARCVHCGDIVDRIISKNRLRRRSSPPRQTRSPIRDTTQDQQDYLFLFSRVLGQQS